MTSLTPSLCHTVNCLIDDLKLTWKEPHLQENRIPRWIKELAESVRGKTAEEMKSDIRKSFKEHSVKPATQIVYLSFLKNLLIQNGELLLPNYITTISVQNKKLCDFLNEQKTNFGKYAVLKNFPFLCKGLLRTDVLINGDILSDTLREDVKKKQEEKLKDRKTLVVRTPVEFLEWVKTSLSQCDSPSQLLQALLLCCGRRISSIFMKPRMVWKYIPGQEECPKIMYREILKKRGRSIWSEIPLLAPARLFLNGLRNFQKDFLLECSDPLVKYGKRHRKWCSSNKFLPGVRLTPRDFRSLYAGFVKRNAEKAEQFFPAAVSRALMHDNLQTSLHYMSVNFIE